MSENATAFAGQLHGNAVEEIFRLRNIRVWLMDKTVRSTQGVYRKSTVLTLNGHTKTAEQRTIIPQYGDHWPLMGGLLHLVQRGGDWAGPLYQLHII